MTTLRQKLEARKLERYQKEQKIEENIALRRNQKRNGLTALLIAGLTAGCVSSIMKYDQVRTAEFEKELNYSTKTNYVASLPQTYTRPDATQKQDTLVKKTNEKFNAQKYQESLDSLLTIKEDMSTEEISQIIEIEKLRLQTYDLTLNELENDSAEDLSPHKINYLKGKFAKFKQYASLVENEVKNYNTKFNFPKPLTANNVYALLQTESGNSPEAFAKDPAQIATQGDHALEALRNGREYSWQIGDFSFLNGKKHTKIAHWKKQYNKSNMDPESSIKGGIGWLINKAAIRNSNGEITGWRDWSEAARRYNGGGDSQYKVKINRNMYQLNALTKL